MSPTSGSNRPIPAMIQPDGDTLDTETTSARIIACREINGNVIQPPKSGGEGSQRLFSVRSIQRNEPSTDTRENRQRLGVVVRKGSASSGRHSLWKLLGRGLRRRCPHCGQGRLFLGWFRMPERCEICGFKFERGPGYWLGSIYVNYGLTAVIVTVTYFVLFFTDALPQIAILWLLTAFCVLFPLCFFRYARSIWM